MHVLSLCAGMLAYGMVKSSTHYLVQSVSQDPSFVEKNASALCVLPSVIDTPGNRAAMPSEDFSNWTKSDDIAQLLVNWVKGQFLH
jgi:dihydropteridine reductase